MCTPCVSIYTEICMFSLRSQKRLDSNSEMKTLHLETWILYIHNTGIIPTPSRAMCTGLESSTTSRQPLVSVSSFLYSHIKLGLLSLTGLKPGVQSLGNTFITHLIPLPIHYGPTYQECPYNFSKVMPFYSLRC